MTAHPSSRLANAPSRRRVIARASAILLALVLAHAVSPARAATAQEQARTIEGWPFGLVDETGRPVQADAFAGRWLLVYFGYTHCPDVCPTGLQTMSTALDALGALADRIVPILISVDPERDTPEAMAAYVRNFRPGLRGLTGSTKAVKAAVRAFGARYFKVYAMPFSDDEALDERKGQPAYTVSHSAIVYLVTPKRRIVKLFPYGITADALAAGIRAVLDMNSEEGRARAQERNG